MTKDEALDLALEALQFKNILNACGQYSVVDPAKAAEAITAIKQARSAPVQEPVATLWQHGETGRTRITMPGDITDCDARWFKAADLYTTPPAAPVQEPEVSWGVDWAKAGDKSCATIIKRLPNGKIEVVAVEYEP
jgi:hypothetical protein